MTDDFDGILNDDGRGQGNNNDKGQPDPGAENTGLEIRQQLEKVQESGLFTIALIGFSTSGKTFFLNRLKKEYRTEIEKGTGAIFDAKPKEPDTGETVEATEDVSLHFFEADRADGEVARLHAAGLVPPAEQSFYIIDVPGEQFRGALKRLGATDSGAGEIENLKKVMSIANALIIVVASNEIFARVVTADDRDLLYDKEEALANLEALPPEELTKGRKGQLTKLRNEIEAITKRINLDTRLNELIEGIGGISRQARLAGGLQTPLTFIALSKADTLQMRGKTAKTRKEHAERIAQDFPHLTDVERIDCDPASLVRLYRPKFHNLVAGHFPWYKFDFVTAFEGQPTRPPSRSVIIDYGRPHYGVLALIAWIRWVRDSAATVGIRSPAGAQAGWRGMLGMLRDRYRAAGVALRVREMRNRAVGLKPSALGLDPAAAAGSRRSWLDPWHSLRAGWTKLIYSAGEAAKIFALSATAVLLLLWVAFNFWPARTPQSQPRFDLKPVYAAEFNRLKRDLKWTPDELISDGLNPWRSVPADNGWFSAPPSTEAGAALTAAIASASTQTSAHGSLSESDKTVVAGLDAAVSHASADAYAVRSALEYHRGVLLDRAGMLKEAQTAFRAALDEANKIQPGSAMRPPYPATRSRIPAMRLQVLNAYGRAALRNGDTANAMQALGEAKALMDQRRNSEGIDANRADTRQYWYQVVSAEPQPIFNFETSDLWANLLAAQIIAYPAASEPQQRQILKTLNDLTLEAQSEDRIGQVTVWPRLASNLQLAELIIHPLHANTLIAPTLSDSTGRFFTQATTIAGAASGYWKVIRNWREHQFPRLPDETPEASQTVACGQVDTDIAAAPADATDLNAWLAEVLKTQFQADPAGQRELRLCYGSHFPNALHAGGWAISLLWLVLLLLPGGVLIYWAWFRVPRVQAICNDLGTPQHRPDRLNKNGGGK